LKNKKQCKKLTPVQLALKQEADRRRKLEKDFYSIDKANKLLQKKHPGEFKRAVKHFGKQFEKEKKLALKKAIVMDKARVIKIKSE
jgi:hypothetical protein